MSELTVSKRRVKDVKGTVYTIETDSLAAVIDYASQDIPNGIRRYSRGISTTIEPMDHRGYVRDWDMMCDQAFYWPGLLDMDSAIDVDALVEPATTKTVVRDHKMPGRVAMGDYIAGRPDCVVTRVDTEAGLNKRHIKIAMNVTGTSASSGGVMVDRARTILTLAESLRLHGHPVTVDVIESTKIEANHYVMVLPIVRPGGSINKDTAAFLLGSREVTMRLVFGWQEVFLKRNFVAGCTNQADCVEIFKDRDYTILTPPYGGSAFVSDGIGRDFLDVSTSAERKAAIERFIEDIRN